MLTGAGQANHHVWRLCFGLDMAEQTQSLVVCCSQCGIPLTLPVCGLPDKVLICEQRGEDYIPRGYFTVSDGSFFRGTEGHLIVNLKDIVNTIHHPDHRRLNGCCGLDGLDGKNTVCEKGHEVGTEHSDCWLPHAMDFDPLAVQKVGV
jgi:hypothetical protein